MAPPPGNRGPAELLQKMGCTDRGENCSAIFLMKAECKMRNAASGARDVPASSYSEGIGELLVILSRVFVRACCGPGRPALHQPANSGTHLLGWLFAYLLVASFSSRLANGMELWEEMLNSMPL